VEAIHAIESGMRASLPEAELIYLEPDFERPYSRGSDPPIR